MIIRPVFRFHVLAVVLGWLNLLPLHIHFSGYGLTKYLSFMDWLRPAMAWVPGMNAYNVLSNCGLPLCGYPLTNLFHGLAGGLIALTVSLLFVTFNLGWYVALSSNSVFGIVIGWEQYEVVTKITRCLPSDFGSVAQVCAEMNRLLADTVADVGAGYVGAILTLAVLWFVDRHAGSEVGLTVLTNAGPH